jgi:hypothetical protein
MPKQRRTLARSLAAGLAVCAIAPGTALAVPANNGPGASPDSGPPVTASGGPGVTAEDYGALDYRAPSEAGSRADGTTKQDLRAPDQTDGRGTGGVVAPTAPQWPVNPQPLATPHSVAAAKPSDDGGVDTGVWIALGAAVLAVAGGIGFAGAKRVRIGRQRQLA